MGFTKVGKTGVACCYSRSGLGGTVSLAAAEWLPRGSV